MISDDTFFLKEQNYSKYSIEYLQFQADCLHRETLNDSKNNSKISQYIVNFHQLIRTLQSITKHIVNINNTFASIENKTKLNNNKKYQEVNPKNEDNSVIIAKFSTENKLILSNIYLPTITVKKLTDIPVSRLYYVEELNEYAFNINGINMNGNLCDISEYESPKSAHCRYMHKCKNMKKCQYYHSPIDYINSGMEISTETRCFTVGSWIYNKNKNNKFARHIGSKSNLEFDLQRLKKIDLNTEIYNRKQQMVHDLLIYLILHANNMTPDHKAW